MPQNQYVQKPYKVLAEQFHAATTPDQAGVCRCTVVPQLADGRPHVHGTRQAYELHEGDWIVQDVWSPHDWQVIPDAEFQDRF
jgi:hypothetical protein